MSLTARAVVEDPLAFTELHLTFDNPEDRVLEGRFRITLPPGATVSRFAMRIGDRWQEGEVVEQQAARARLRGLPAPPPGSGAARAEAGNEFSARVFPIPAGGHKELIVSYSQELTRAGEPYRLPLRGLPGWARCDPRARESDGSHRRRLQLGGVRAQHEVVEVQRSDFVARRDFEVPLAGGRLGPARTRTWWSRASSPSLTPTGADRADVAGGAGRHQRLARARLRRADRGRSSALLAELARQTGDPAVTVAAFDQDVAPVFTGKASGLGGVVRKRLAARRRARRLRPRACARLAGDPAKEHAGRACCWSPTASPPPARSAADKLRARVKALAAVGRPAARRARRRRDPRRRDAERAW